MNEGLQDKLEQPSLNLKLSEMLVLVNSHKWKVLSTAMQEGKDGILEAVFSTCLGLCNDSL